MITNYLKLAWRVLGRNPFFTFISLFGISFTLGILMVITSFLQSEIGASAPITKKDNMVLVSSLHLRRVYYDTIVIVDTIYQENITLYDTTFQYKENGDVNNSNSSLNNKIAEEYLNELPSVEAMTVLAIKTKNDVYVNGVKLSLRVIRADAAYWQVFNHQLLDGRYFDQSEMDNASRVLVLSDKTAIAYYGHTDVIDKEFVLEGETFKIIGLYKHKGKVVDFVSPDGVVPYSTMDLSIQPSFYFGSFMTIFLKKPNVSSERLKDEIQLAAGQIPLDHPDNKYNFTEVRFNPKAYHEMFAQGIYYDEDPSKSLVFISWILFFLILFFILLPTLNLINLNVSRILERSSEIGVRKAFGAHQGNIIFQFVIENLIQTIIGGILGLGLALILIRIINQGGYLGTGELYLNINFFIFSFILTVLFGILSGLLPAYRMSKLQIVKALKENQL